MAYLKNHQVLSSNNLDELRAVLSTLANTAEIDVVGKGCEINGAVNSASFCDLSLTHVTYGDVSTRVQEHGGDADVLLLLMLTEGAASVQHQGQEFDISTDVGLIRDVREPLLACQDQFACFGLPLPITTLKHHARTLFGEAADWVDMQLGVELDFTTPGARHVQNTIYYVANALDGPLHNCQNSIVLDGFKDILLTNILTLLPNSHAQMAQDYKVSSVTPYYVKRARDYIHAHAHVSITLEDLVSYAGCGFRTLQVAFNDVYGMSPMAYLKTVRLSLANKDLLTADGGVTVSDIALKWGFTHLGRFSQMYAKQFGVLPSQTLRSRR